MSSGVKALAVIAGLLVAAFLTLKLYSNGSVIVRDADSSLAHVELKSGEQTIPAHRFLGLHWVLGGLEGEAVAKCRNGARINLGYFTSTFHIWETVRAADCNSSARRTMP